MTSFQRPPRTAHFDDVSDAEVAGLFPSDVEIEIEFVPRAIFGEDPPDAKLQRVMPGDDKIMIELVDTFAGTHTVVGSRPFAFARLEGTGELGDVRLTMSGAMTVLRKKHATSEEFAVLVTRATYDLPPILSTLFGEAVTVRAISGRAADRSFHVRVIGDADFLIRHDTDNLAPRIEKNMGLLWECAGSPRIRVAMTYLQQAQRLRYVSTFPGEFLAERLLNLGKIIEILFLVKDPKKRIEETRQQLRALEFPEDAIEIIASIAHVRNQLDVGHPVLDLLTADDYATAQFFAVRAEDAATYLVMHIAKAIRDGKHQFPEQTIQASERDKLMVPMRQHEDVSLDPFDDRPSSGVWARVRHRMA